MLDECKGDKFYEVLALFSNAVLKKVLAAQDCNEQNAPAAKKLAIATTLSGHEQQSLLPLAIAHKAALVYVLRKKEQKRRRYLNFERLLDDKTTDIHHRIRQSKATPRAAPSAVPQKEADAIKKQLRDNWIGNQKWLDVMLHGDNVQANEVFLTSRFDKIWRMVEHGRELENVTVEAGLLENLQSRVQEQQTRLRKWRTFHEKLQEDKAEPVSATAKPQAMAKEFRFHNHVQLQMPSKRREPNVSKPNEQRQSVRPEYADILSEMNIELSRVSTSKPARVGTGLSRRRTSSSTSRSPARSRKNTRSESEIQPPLPTKPSYSTRPVFETKKSSSEDAPVLRHSRHAAITATPADSDATLIGYASTARGVDSVRPTADSSDEHAGPEADPNMTEIADDTVEEPLVEVPAVIIEDSPQPTHRSPSPEPSSAYPSEPPTPMIYPPELNAEEALAERIITSIGDATPSPVKKPQPRMSMSLIERTRMSMARTNSFEPVAESPLPLPSPELPDPPTVQADGDRRATLLERTRLSMMAMQSKPRQSLAPHDRKEKRKSRASLFPVNQFDTPRNRKSFELIEESKDTDPEKTPKETLFSDEVDYDRVFKSRPRIATSPVFSPPAGVNEEEYDDDDPDGVTGIDLGDVDQDEDDDGFTKSWQDSPSRMRAGKLKY